MRPWGQLLLQYHVSLILIESFVTTRTELTIATPSTPSDISYNTVQEIRSPSPYKPTFDSLGGLLSELEGNPPPSPFSSLQNVSHIHSQQDTFGTDIANILVEDGSLFEGQSPAPFTAPPSPAPSQIHDIRTAPSNSLPSMVMDGNFASSANDVPDPFSSGIAALPETHPVQTPPKKRYKQKEELELTQRLNDLQSKYGSDHPATLDTAARLARVFMHQNRYRSAERLYKQSAESLQKTLGKDNPSTLGAFSELSYAFREQGQYSKAKTLSQLIYSRASKVLHPSHETLLYIENELAICYLEVGNDIEAERLLREVLVHGRETLLPDNTVMVFAMEQLTKLLCDMGEFFEAEKMLVAIENTNVLTGDFLQQAITRSRLGYVWMAKGEFQKAEGIVREVFEVQKQHLGPENRDTLNSQINLGMAQKILGKFLEAGELLRDAVHKVTKLLGRNHASTLEAEVFLAACLIDQQKFEEADGILQKVLGVSEEVYGWDSRWTCYAADALRDSYHRQGRLEEAHSAAEKYFRGYLGLLGPNHRLTKIAEEQFIFLLNKGNSGESFKELS
jgi:tetratricopeptide (TPR) repeat protein